MNRTDSATVVDLSGYRPQARPDAINLVEGYWEGLRNGRLLPDRADVDARGIASALQYSFVLERVAPGIGRFRLAGMHLNDLMDMEVRGMPLTAMILPDARETVSKALERVFSGPEIVQLSLVADGNVWRKPLDGRMILLPLRGDLGNVTRALGCLTTDGPIGRAPRRFRVVDQRRRSPTCEAGGIGDQARTPDAAGSGPAGSSRGCASDGAVGRPVAGRPHLRLVQTDA